VTPDECGVLRMFGNSANGRSLGVVGHSLVGCLTGRAPFLAGDQKVMRKRDEFLCAAGLL
jgi:hypothetical protein